MHALTLIDHKYDYKCTKYNLYALLCSNKGSERCLCFKQRRLCVYDRYIIGMHAFRNKHSAAFFVGTSMAAPHVVRAFVVVTI